MSKGSAPRPLSVSEEEYRTRWDAIFQREKLEPEIVQDPALIRAAFEQDEVDYKSPGNER